MKRVVEVEFEQDSLIVTYDRDALAEAIAEGAPSALLAEKPIDKQIAETWATVDVLANAIVSWNLYDEGRAYPIDRENLSHLPISLLLKISQAIATDAFEGD
jgi:hypothetical protein